MMYGILSEKPGENKNESNIGNTSWKDHSKGDHKKWDRSVEDGVWKDGIGGHQTAGVGHQFVEDFVERQKKLLFSASSWNSDRQIKLNHAGFCVLQKHLKNQKSVKDPFLSGVMRTRKLFSSISRLLRP